MVASSNERLQVGPRHPGNAAQLSRLKHGVQLLFSPFKIKLERLTRRVHADLIAVLEAVGNRLLGTVDSYRCAVEPMYSEAKGERPFGEPEYSDRRVIEPRRFRSARQRQINLVGDLGGQLVECKPRDKADYNRRNLERDRNQVRVAERRKVGWAVKTAAESSEFAGVAEPV